ncbi:MAG: hypothetical protein ABL901_17640 [Hyphomicrobiaceae bacterium]
MAYRGEDLDLRTPQTWSGAASDMTGGPEPYSNGSRGRSGGFSRSAPILVDEIVLSCSNHAFDVAVAHRAGEVRLEHLLHAMTRVDGASNALEARGIRVAGLRRESATIIAGEIPLGLSPGQGHPRRSDDFEQALRTASAIAYRRNAPANVDDLMDALLDMPSDIPGIALLARHGGRVARDRPQLREPLLREPLRDPNRDREIYREPQREWDQPAFQPLPPLTRASSNYAPDARSKAPIPYYADDRHLDRQPERQLRSGVGSAVDGIQNARIEQLETAVRTLASELSTDRKTDRDDAIRFRGGLHDRLQSLEQSVVQAANGDGGAGLLLDRLTAVERGLDQRLNELSRPWSLLADRLQALEQTMIENRGTKSAEVTVLQDRLIGLERGMFDQIKGLERTLEAAPAVDMNPITSRLDIIEEAVLNPATNQAENDKLAERMRALEESINAQRAQVNQTNAALNHDIKSLGAALSNQAANNERVHSFVSDRIQTLTSGFERQRMELAGPLTERIGSLATIFDGRMQTFAGLAERNKVDVTAAIETRHAQLASILDTRNSELLQAIAARNAHTQDTLAALTERMAAFEANLTLSFEKAAEAQAIHTAELKEVHEALIKLNTNQHTLAGSIDQWRLDGVGDISVIANRLDGIEKSAAKPVQMIETLTASVDNINRATVERYHRRNRFMYWLFGTDDWLTASWPSQTASVEAERAMLRGAASNTAVPKVPQQPASTRPAQR